MGSKEDFVLDMKDIFQSLPLKLYSPLAKMVFVLGARSGF